MKLYSIGIEIGNTKANNKSFVVSGATLIRFQNRLSLWTVRLQRKYQQEGQNVQKNITANQRLKC